MSSWALLDVNPGSGISLGKVWLAKPLVIADQICFSGYVENADEHTCIRIRDSYGNVVCASPNPGFLITLPECSCCYQLELWHQENCIRTWEVTDAEREAFARSGMVTLPSDGPKTPAQEGIKRVYAFFGRMGHLFLGDDSNDSIGQFSENRVLGAGSVAGWTHAFDQLPGWKHIYKLKNISLLIAPAKEEILREYYPLPRAQRTVLDEFMARFHDREILLPKWELWNKRHLAYSTTETHWTDFGATTAALAVLRAWGIPDEGLPTEFCVKLHIGDLGNKVTPHQCSYDLFFLPEILKRRAFYNGIINHGHISVFHNSGAPNEDRLIIFGDSFGSNLAEAFSGVFQEVTYAYQPAGLDPDLVAIVKPHHVLLQITQRFLHGSPPVGSHVFDNARKKITEMCLDEKNTFLERLKQADKAFLPLVAPLINQTAEFS